MPFALTIVAICAIISRFIDTHFVVVARAFAEGAISVFVARVVIAFVTAVVALLAAAVGVAIIAMIVSILPCLCFSGSDLGVFICFFDFGFNVEGIIRSCLCVHLTLS